MTEPPSAVLVHAAQVHGALLARGATVAVAESLTAGLLAAALTATPGASATVRGGVVVYATDLKVTLGGVPADLLAAHGPVSEPVTAALAAAVRVRLGATFGLALTGVAGPTEQDGVAVGTVYAGLAAPDRTTVVHRTVLPGDREQVRAGAVVAALSLLGQELGLPSPG